jgi:integrase
MKITCLETRPDRWRLRIETVDGATGERKFAYETVQGDHEAAARRRFEILRKHDEGSFAQPSKLTVKKYLETWLDDRQTMGIVSRLTAENERAVIGKWIVPAFGAVKLQALTARQIQDLYKAMLKKGLASITVRALHQNILRPALAEARTANLIGANPLDGVTAPQASRPAPRAFDPATVERLLRGLAGTWIEDISLFALGTGLRRGEACGLRWKDVDLAARVIHVRGELVQYSDSTLEWKEPKTEAGKRKVSLPAPVVELLSSIRGRATDLAAVRGDAYVFTDGADPIKPRALSSAFKHIARKCGVEGRGAFHRLRHTHITTLLQNVGREGAKAVSQRVGHANVMITLHVYQTVFENEDAGLADLAAGLFAARK